MTGPLGYANMGITVGKILFVFSFILGILVVPTEVYAVIMHSFFFFFEGGGGEGANKVYFGKSQVCKWWIA